MKIGPYRQFSIRNRMSVLSRLLEVTTQGHHGSPKVKKRKFKGCVKNHVGAQIVYKTPDPLKNDSCAISNIAKVARTRIRPVSVWARSIWITCMPTGHTFINIIARCFVSGSTFIVFRTCITDFISGVTIASKRPDRVSTTGILSAIMGHTFIGINTSIIEFFISGVTFTNKRPERVSTTGILRAIMYTGVTLIVI